MIRTPAGEFLKDTLRSGMQVITLVDGEEIPQTVTWLGHRRISLAAHPQPETVAPIRIERDAFADGMPHRDLLVSPDHAIFVDGVLICARQLVNGTTIRTGTGDGRPVHYYHVDNQHAILMAEGPPAESYLDTGNSGFFANSEAPLVLHPDLTYEADYPTREAGSCAPFVTDEASVQPVWQRLFDRAAAIGRAVPLRSTTTDADLRLLADRHTVKPVISDSDRVVFVLPHGAREVRLVSRAQSPTEARPWLGDRRRLGVRVKRIVLRGADGLREVPVDHPDLSQGWWAVEHDGPMLSRWTDGEAALPLPAMSGHVVLEIHLAGAMTFVEDAVPVGGSRASRCLTPAREGSINPLLVRSTGACRGPAVTCGLCCPTPAALRRCRRTLLRRRAATSSLVISRTHSIQRASFSNTRAAAFLIVPIIWARRSGGQRGRGNGRGKRRRLPYQSGNRAHRAQCY